MVTEGRKIYQVPCQIGLFAFLLKVPSNTSTVDLESDVVVDITSMANVVNVEERYFGCNYVVCGLHRLCAREIVEICGKLVYVNIKFCVG